MNETIQKRLLALRAAMKKSGADAALFPTSDYHASEYVGEFFETRRYFSGFTGSAGTLAVLPGEAGLWTDGRYFIQAALELSGTGVTLYRIGDPGVPLVEDFLLEKLPRGGTLALDGKTVDAHWCEALLQKLAAKDISLSYDTDPADGVWEDRPALPGAPAWLLPLCYAGKPASEKLAAVRAEMEKCGADVHVLTTLDDIAWLFNLRGGDVLYTPVLLAYAVIEQKAAYLFADAKKLSAELSASLAECGVQVLPYGGIYQFVEKYTRRNRVLLNKRRVNYALYEILRGHALLVNGENPTTPMKAVKNEAEAENFRRAHVKDGAAVTKLIYWLKTHDWKEPLTELDAARHMDALRRGQEGCIDLSFTTIPAYGPHAAINHYHATEENCIPLQPRGFFLLDSGGQYYEGTTDITRTVALGPLTDEEKRHFTLVLKSMLRLSHARFPYGCTGQALDAIAREPIWAEGLNYNHGTGHGIGYLLCVHEGPNSFRYRQLPGREEPCVFEPGMVTSVEPGIYVENSHGIRTENLALCREARTTDFGRFLEFETLTLAPIDLDAVDETMLLPEEKEWLNAYHRRVYDEISPLLTPDERAFLKQATRSI